MVRPGFEPTIMGKLALGTLDFYRGPNVHLYAYIMKDIRYTTYGKWMMQNLGTQERECRKTKKKYLHINIMIQNLY